MKSERFDEFEEGLSRWVGDIAAHRIGRALRTAAGYGERVTQTAADNVREYLEEESRDLAARAEVAAFCAEVDEVHRAVEALEARIRALTTRP